ncbi:MAG: ShlB/FhaC/HecB family hemolysin secretion/activation protein [Alphaproteobacteria bacterium]|nr:ShlB/FhaC/HecB family hemolysin secretion/activation protein [Alphaproteobacteria bacterium]
MTSNATTRNTTLTITLTASVALTSLLAASSAFAQNVPTSVDASQIGRRFEEAPAPLQSGDLGLPLPSAPKELSQAQQDKLSKVKFVLKRLSVAGNTAFTEEELKPTYESLVDKKISLLDAQSVARKITDMYQKAGYVLSQAVVPQQEISKGTLKIRIVEGFVSNIVIQGDIKSDSEREIIAAHLASIKNQRPVNTKELERKLLLINDLPGATIRGLLRPSPTEFGAAELVVNVERKAFDASASVDNRGSKFVGPWQYNATVAANSLFGLYDRTQLRLTTSSPSKELRGFELQHDELLGTDGTKLSLLASRTHTEPGDSLKNIDIVGDSDLFEAKVTHPFIRSRQENLVARALFDVRNADTDVFNNVDFTKDRLRIARIGGNYNFFDQFRGNNFIDAQLSQGLDAFGATDDGANRTNSNGEADFSKLNVDLSRLQPLPKNFSILATASGQYSLDPLLISEQFSLGGTSFGTAYDPAEVLGDSGISGKLELRYNGVVGSPYFNSYQLFTYYDIGRAWIREGAPNANDKRSLASWGGGVRTSFTENLSSSLEVAVPLTKPASNQGGHGDDARIFFATTARF